MTLSAKSSVLHLGSHLLSTLISLLALLTSTSTPLAIHFHLHSPPYPLPCLSSSFCCSWGAHLRSRSFYYQNHLFPPIGGCLIINSPLSLSNFGKAITCLLAKSTLEPPETIRTHLSVQSTAHPMSAVSIGPRSAADCLIRSAVDISHPRQQRNFPASSSAASCLVCSDIIKGLGAGADGGVGNPLLVSGMTTDVNPDPVDSTSAPLSSGRGNYLSTQSPTSYHSASSSPSARWPSSGFDGVNEVANVRANTTAVNGHANVRASAGMTHVNDNDADDSIFDDTLCEILGASSRVAPSFDLDLTFGAVNVYVDLACTSLLSPSSPLPPTPYHRLSSSFCCCWGAHLRSRSLGFTIIIIYFPYWWFSY